MTRPLVLLPSSKAKADDGAGPAFDDSAALRHGPMAGLRREVLAGLQAAASELDDRGVARLCGVRVEQAAQQRAMLAGVAAAPTMPAHRRYTGVVHRFAALDAVAPDDVHADVAVLSGLLGVAMLDEPVPPYRLEVTGRVPGLGVLGTWWRHRLGEILRALGRSRRVWDLLPGEFARLWPDEERGEIEVVSVRFERPDGRAAPAASAKVAKGRLLRLLLDHPTATPTDVVTAQALTGWRLEHRGPALAAVLRD